MVKENVCAHFLITSEVAVLHRIGEEQHLIGVSAGNNKSNILSSRRMVSEGGLFFLFCSFYLFKVTPPACTFSIFLHNNKQNDFSHCGRKTVLDNRCSGRTESFSVYHLGLNASERLRLFYFEVSLSTVHHLQGKGHRPK